MVKRKGSIQRWLSRLTKKGKKARSRGKKARSRGRAKTRRMKAKGKESPTAHLHQVVNGIDYGIPGTDSYLPAKMQGRYNQTQSHLHKLSPDSGKKRRNPKKPSRKSPLKHRRKRTQTRQRKNRQEIANEKRDLGLVVSGEQADMDAWPFKKGKKSTGKGKGFNVSNRTPISGKGK